MRWNRKSTEVAITVVLGVATVVTVSIQMKVAYHPIADRSTFELTTSSVGCERAVNEHLTMPTLVEHEDSLASIKACPSARSLTLLFVHLPRQ